MSPRKKRVLIFGTFDLLHTGHRALFTQAAQLGQVTAIVARDANVLRIKGHAPVHSQRSRLARVAADTSITHARLGDQHDFLAPVRAIAPDIIALGYDQKTYSTAKLKSALKSLGLTPEIIRLWAYEPRLYKSSLLRKKL